MGIKSLLIRPYADFVSYKVRQWSEKPVEAQDKVLKSIVNIAANTVFGKAHQFNSIKSYGDFKKLVPLKNYEQFKPYIERIINREKDITWPGKPLYEGREGALELIAEWTASFEEYRWEVDQIDEVGDLVLTLVHHRGISGSTRIVAPAGAVWRLEGGAVVEVWFYFSWDEARAAVAARQAVN